jgi:hypothetical protein
MAIWRNGELIKRQVEKQKVDEMALEKTES